MQIPLYQIIENEIKEQIQSKKLKEGDLIPSENQLTEIYNVSRMTVRQALNNLVNDGYLYKHKGRGTFVAPRKIEKSIQGVRGFTEEMEGLGKVVSSKVVKFLVLEPSEEIREKLFLKEDEKAIYVERIRYGDKMPILFETLYIPQNLFKDLTAADMEESFYTYIEKEKGYRVSHCVQSIEAQMPKSKHAEMLKINKNMPVLKIIRNTFLNNGRPFEYVISIYRSDQYRFVQYAFKG
ncbi:MAG: GntR family transcriptional regulator [Acholeplasmataceae bacterium]|jgi:GntR family transcriptional regulator|nr:GntR family transcriptional regulator [Acholeplasmataceae bacterium]